MEEELWTEQRANAAYEAWRARGVMANGRKLNTPAKPYVPPQTPAGKVNVTDPDSRNVKTPRGYMQGYNAQAVVGENQIVIAAEVNADSPDFGHLEPMVTAAEHELEKAGVSEAPEVVVADPGYWHQVQMENVVPTATATSGAPAPASLARAVARHRGHLTAAADEEQQQANANSRPLLLGDSGYLGGRRSLGRTRRDGRADRPRAQCVVTRRQARSLGPNGLASRRHEPVACDTK